MDPTRYRVRRIRALPCIAAIALVTASCASTSTPSRAPVDPASPSTAIPAASASPAPAASPTERPSGSYEACDGPATAPITLTVRDAEAPDVVGGILAGLNREFEAANPGVTVRREAVSPDDLAASIVADLGRADGPDVAQVPQGPAGLGEAVKAGVVLPLGEAEAVYGWASRWAPRTLARLRLSDDGSRLGEGSLYGVPVTGELAGLILSDEVAHSRPLREPPTTLAEDMEDFAAVKEAGIVPILVAGGDGDLLLLYGSILGSLVTPEWLDDFVYRRDGASFDTPQTVEAATLLAEMQDRGFLAQASATMSRDEALARLLDGKAQWLVAGSSAWPAVKASGDPYGLVTLEPETAGTIPLAVGGTGLPFVVRAGSPNAGCAAAYLDFITSDHAMEQVAALELTLPSHVSARALGSDPWYRDMTFAYRDIEAGGRLGHHLEWAFPGAAQTFKAELTRLVQGASTPGQFTQAIETAYRASLPAAR